MNIPYNIIAKYYANEISAKENEELQKWILENSENKKLFDKYKQNWEKADSEIQMPDFDAEKALNKIELRLKNKKHFKIGLLQILAIAVSLLVLFGIYFFGFQNNNSGNFAYAEIENNTDSAMFYELPDKSKAWLKTGSSIEFAENFSDSLRRVILNGTAYFEVEHNSAKAFVVECGKVEIKVLGTKFNVEITENSVETNLLEGKIQFYESKSVENSIVLSPNERVTYNVENSEFKKKQFNDKNCLAWKTCILSFDEVLFSEVVNELEKYYGKEIIIQNDDLKTYSFTGSFDNKSFEEVINMLQIILQIEVVKEKEKTILKW